MDKNKTIKAFEEYVNLFDKNHPYIKLKHAHTYRTFEISKYIEKRCNDVRN